MSEFAGAGTQAGLELWRIEKLKPVKLSAKEANSGRFHVGDSYILLATVLSKSNKKSWNVHFWLGSETSQDESGVAAYKTIELDDYLGGAAVQYREVQGSESNLFLSYYKGEGSGHIIINNNIIIVMNIIIITIIIITMILIR